MTKKCECGHARYNHVVSKRNGTNCKSGCECKEYKEVVVAQADSKSPTEVKQ